MKRIVLQSVAHHFASRHLSSGLAKAENISLFKELSLTINSGESHAIVGPSGAGKSSLLLILAGLATPTAGSVGFFDDTSANSNSTTGQSINQLKQQSGFIFQQFQLLPELDALANIALPLKLRGDKQANAKARQWLDKVGLSQRAKHKPNELSGGEQQRVAIARAFVADPAFVFADEPTGNLDEKTARQISELMFECSHTNKTGLVIVTHNSALSQQADHCYHLEAGSLREVV